MGIEIAARAEYDGNISAEDFLRDGGIEPEDYLNMSNPLAAKGESSRDRAEGRPAQSAAAPSAPASHVSKPVHTSITVGENSPLCVSVVGDQSDDVVLYTFKRLANTGYKTNKSDMIVSPAEEKAYFSRMLSEAYGPDYPNSKPGKDGIVTVQEQMDILKKEQSKLEARLAKNRTGDAKAAIEFNLNDVKASIAALAPSIPVSGRG